MIKDSNVDDNMVKLTPHELAKVFSTALCQPHTSRRDLADFINAVKKHPFVSVAVETYNFPLLVELLKNTEIDAACTISYPQGGLQTDVKVDQVKWAIDHGADEIDVVMNISAFKSRKYDEVKEEMVQIVNAAKGRIVKFIPCTTYLTPNEIRRVARMMAEAGVSILKTNAGYKQVTKYSDVKIIKEEVGDRLFVMPAGGVRNADIALGMINAGADRIDSGTPFNVLNTLPTAMSTYTKEELEKIANRVEDMNRNQPKVRRKVHD